MELVVVGPVLLLMAGLMLYITYAGRAGSQRAVTPWSGIAFATGETDEAPMPAVAGAEARRLSQADVLLADILTELLQLKEEVGELRARVDLINQDVQALSSRVDPGQSWRAA